MFTSSKPMASLSSGLLARKGQARPAMRPQGFHSHSANLDDLGWDDMGEADAPTPMANVPPVLAQRAKLHEEIAVPTAPEPVAVEDAPAPQPVSPATAARIGREVRAGKPKAAFTLRLDSDRHLRLRLASATRHRSAQSLVTEALDALLQSLPDVEELARQLPGLEATRSSGEQR